MNPDLQKERANASFDTKQMVHVIYLGEQIISLKRHIESLGLSDPDFDRKAIVSMSREEAYEEGIRIGSLIPRKTRAHSIDDSIPQTYVYRNSVLPNFLTPMQLHTTMFIPIIQSQATKEQQKYWIDRAEKGEVLATYVQTELGHGTFIRGLETTATYDEKTEEFILNTPTLTSIKWWPGGLGKTCNHAIVMAQLYTKGTCHGVHPFIIQLRDLETHKTLPGLTLGDIGAKIGFPTVDNGFLKCDNYRIPRFNMLMKHAQVSADGTYTRKVSSKVVYGGMLMVRATMLGMVSIYLAQACTIAVRFSAVRRQSEITKGSGEVQVLDFQTQQEKVLPCLAHAYALLFTSQSMMAMYFTVQGEMTDGNYSLLEQLHSSASGLKAYCTGSCLRMVETLRQACGGHGFLNSSGLTKLFSELNAAVTYEGDNTVMSLQSARLLMKYCEQVRNGEKMTGLVEYLNTDLNQKCSIGQSCTIEQLVSACEHRAARMLLEASVYISDQISHGHPSSIAWNLTSVRLAKAALAHSQLYTIRAFVEVTTRDLDPSVKAALTVLCRLHTLHNIITHLGDYTVDGYISTSQANILQHEYELALAHVRRDAVAFVDAFDIPDEILQSDLGRYDGQIYQALYDSAQKSELNKTDVHPSFHKYLKPMMDEMKREATKSKL